MTGDERLLVAGGIRFGMMRGGVACCFVGRADVAAEFVPGCRAAYVEHRWSVSLNRPLPSDGLACAPRSVHSLAVVQMASSIQSMAGMLCRSCQASSTSSLDGSLPPMAIVSFRVSSFFVISMVPCR